MKQVSDGVVGHGISLSIAISVYHLFSLDKMQNKSDLGSVYSEGLGHRMLFFSVWVVWGFFWAWFFFFS